jgi:hypothetical protein
VLDEDDSVLEIAADEFAFTLPIMEFEFVLGTVVRGGMSVRRGVAGAAGIGPKPGNNVSV